MRPRRRGKYRQRVQLWDVPETPQDSYGQPSPAGVQIVNAAALDGCFWARIEPFRGQELTDIRTQWAVATHKVGMLWLGSALAGLPNNPYNRLLPRMYIIDTLDGTRIDFLDCQNVEKRNRAWECIGQEKVLN